MCLKGLSKICVYEKVRFTFLPRNPRRRCVIAHLYCFPKKKRTLKLTRKRTTGGYVSIQTCGAIYSWDTHIQQYVNDYESVSALRVLCSLAPPKREREGEKFSRRIAARVRINLSTRSLRNLLWCALWRTHTYVRIQFVRGEYILDAKICLWLNVRHLCSIA